MTATLSEARKRADKELAHLTTSRISGHPVKKYWDVGGLAAELRPLLYLFIQNALPARLSPKVKAAIF